MNNDLIQKLMISKKIMDRHNEIPRRQNDDNIQLSRPVLEEFSPANATYNLPTELLSESQLPKPQSSPPTKDRILNSKLPEDIKRLMLEHPINQPQMVGPTLSNELVEAASRLMKTDKGVSNQKTNNQPKNLTQPNINLNEIKNIIRETIEEVLKENGLLIESTSKSNDNIKFQVGEHIFEGKITKIKKIKNS